MASNFPKVCGNPDDCGAPVLPMVKVCEWCENFENPILVTAIRMNQPCRGVTLATKRGSRAVA